MKIFYPRYRSVECGVDSMNVCHMCSPLNWKILERVRTKV